MTALSVPAWQMPPDHLQIAREEILVGHHGQFLDGKGNLAVEQITKGGGGFSPEILKQRI